MLSQRLRRWRNVKPTLAGCLLFHMTITSKRRFSVVLTPITVNPARPGQMPKSNRTGDPATKTTVTGLMEFLNLPGASEKRQTPQLVRECGSMTACRRAVFFGDCSRGRYVFF